MVVSEQKIGAFADLDTDNDADAQTGLVDMQFAEELLPMPNTQREVVFDIQDVLKTKEGTQAVGHMRMLVREDASNIIKQ